MTGRQIVRICVIGVLASLLSGCPVPLLPGDESGSRTNVPDQVPGFIVVGKTTRGDVLLGVGEPDTASENQRQFTYDRYTRRGGALFIGAANGGVGGFVVERVTYRRLTVLFDEAGVVTSAELDRDTCTQGGLDLDGHYPCLAPPVADLGFAGSIDASRPSGQGRAFDDVLWYEDTQGFDLARLIRRNVPETPIRGVLLVTDTALELYPTAADSASAPLFRLEYANVAAVSVATFGLSKRVVIRRRDGGYASFAIQHEQRIDRTTTRRAGEWIESRRRRVAAQ